MTGAIGVSELPAWRRYLAVAILALVLLVNHTDRFVLGILVEPIKRDLELSDSEIGLLTGPAFAMVYAICVIPLARLADRSSRVRILTLCLLVWSAATAACGMAGAFMALLLARMLVGAGEAGGIAPSMAIVSDIFPAAQRAQAMSLFALGASAGALVAPVVGGVLLEEVGWRGTFLALGLAGAPIALLLAFVREPQRGAGDALAQPASPVPLGATLRRLFARRAFALIIVAYVLVAFAQYATMLWLPAFFERSYGLARAALGASLGLYQGVPLLLGTLLGVPVAGKLVAKDQRWLVWLPMLASATSAPATAALFAVSDVSVALAILAIPSFIGGLAAGATYALIQNLAAVHSRATATGVFAFCVTVAGAGLGPLTLGVLSDALSSSYGAQSLRYAFFLVSPIYACAATAFWAMTFSLARDMDDARRDSLPSSPP